MFLWYIYVILFISKGPVSSKLLSLRCSQRYTMNLPIKIITQQTRTASVTQIGLLRSLIRLMYYLLCNYNRICNIFCLEFIIKTCPYLNRGIIAV